MNNKDFLELHEINQVNVIADGMVVKSDQRFSGITPSEELFGIDLGTTNSCISRFTANGPQVISIDGSAIVPSVVARNGDAWLVGQEALNWSRIHPELAAQSFKRHMGESDHMITIGEQKFSPEYCSQRVLEYLKRGAEMSCGCTVSSVVITIPAWFGEKQRQATLRAGRNAGLKVVRLIHEPTAASLVYQESSTVSWKNRQAEASPSSATTNLESSRVMAEDAVSRGDRLRGEAEFAAEPELWAVYDLGGGTFDISVVSVRGDVLEVQASCGNSYLGGDDFDAVLADNLLSYLKESVSDLPADPLLAIKLKHIAERAKIELSKNLSVEIKEILVAASKTFDLNLTLRREEFEAMISPLLEGALDKVKEALSEARVMPEQITRLLLVGGSTRIPLVQHQLSQFFLRPPEGYVDPDLSVSMGAAIQAGLAAGRDLKRIVVDVCPHTLGIATLCRESRNPLSDPLAKASIEQEIFKAMEGDKNISADRKLRIIANAFKPEMEFSPLIRRNAKLPVKVAQRYQKVFPTQEAADIQVYQGDSSVLEENQLVGAFRVSFRNDRSSALDVTFEYDVNGVVKIGVAEDAGASCSHTMNLLQSFEDNSDAHHNRSPFEAGADRWDSRGDLPNGKIGFNSSDEVDDGVEQKLPGSRAKSFDDSLNVSNYLIQQVERLLAQGAVSGGDKDELISILERYRLLLTDDLGDGLDELEDKLYDWLDRCRDESEEFGRNAL